MKLDAHRRKIDNEIQSYEEDDKEKKEETLKGRKNFGLHDLLKETKMYDILSSVYPNWYKLLHHFYFL